MSVGSGRNDERRIQRLTFLGAGWVCNHRTGRRETGCLYLGLGSTLLLGSLVASLRGATAIIDGRGGFFFVISEHKAAFMLE